MNCNVFFYQGAVRTDLQNVEINSDDVKRLAGYFYANGIRFAWENQSCTIEAHTNLEIELRKKSETANEMRVKAEYWESRYRDLVCTLIMPVIYFVESPCNFRVAACGGISLADN